MSNARAMLCCGVCACALPTCIAAQQPLQMFRLGTEFQVNTMTIAYQGDAALAIDARGNFIVAWASLGQDGDAEGVFGRRYASSGTPMGAEFQANTQTISAQRHVNVAADGDGDFVVAWMSYGQDGDGYGVFAQRFSSSGAASGTEFAVNTYVANDQREVAAAMDGDGDFVIAWISSGQDGEGYGVFAQRFTSAGVDTGTEFQVNTHTVARQYHPSIASDFDGDFTVVWGASADHDGYGSGVFGQRYASSGAASGAEFQVNAYTISYQGDYGWQAIATDADGDFVVVWGDYPQDGSTYGVFGQRFAGSGVRVGTEFQANSYTIGDQGGFFEEVVATDASGNALVAWTSNEQDSSDFGVFAQAFASAGTRVGAEFQVNSATLGVQYIPAVEADFDGDFVVVWQGSDGSYGIFGQRYVLAFELKSQLIPGASSFGTETGEGDGATASDRIESTITSPNPGTVTVAEKPPAIFPIFGYAIIGQLVDISAPPATAGSPLQIVFELDRSLFAGNVGDPNVQVYRNLALVPDCSGVVSTCSGGPTVASPDPCVASRCLQGDLDAQVTVLTSSASGWSFAVPCTTGFAKGLFLVKEKVVGKEKLIAKLIGGPAVPQNDFGDPLSIGGTAYRLRVYDDAQTLVAEIPVERAGAGTCSGGSTTCWKALGGTPPEGKGYKYKDSDAAANGVTQVMLKSAASSKLLFKAKGPAPPFPDGVAAALSSTTSVTVELHGNDAPAGCFAATLTDIETQEPYAFKAK